MRAWTATALLAGSWLLGMDYFQGANYLAWVGFVLAAVALLTDVPVRLPRRSRMVLVLVLLLPAVGAVPWPLKAIPTLLTAGVILTIAPIPRGWPRTAGRAAIVAGTILLAQSLVLWGYQIVTARNHELPRPLAHVLGTLAHLLGIDATVDGATIAMHSVSSAERFATTWELLLDPASLCFVVGGMVLLGLVTRAGPCRTRRLHAWINGSATLLILAMVWAPLRAGLLMALVLQRSLRADAVTAPNVGEILVNSWMHILLLGGLTLLVVRLIPLGLEMAAEGQGDAADNAGGSSLRPRRWRQIVGPILVGSAIATLSAMVWWAPVGQTKSGRIMVVERHSTWEPTTEPYGTQVYGEAGSYNYAAAYAFCGQFYEMSRLLESDPITDDRLDRCDVLIIKTPTARYTPEEVAAVVGYVEHGGSLLMVGDHTNVFNMNTYLNDISRHFGFTFRNDLLFRVGTPYRQTYRGSVVRHPVVQYLPPMNFAVSCSIDPGLSWGDMVIRSTGLWNLPPAYHESNYHPQAEYRANMQYGAWCQLWSTRFGDGRVLAFADSTLFSNFCVFQPGKAELLIGMLQWLNHGNRLGPREMLRLRVAGSMGGLLLLLAGLWIARDSEGTWLVLIAAGLAAWTGASWAVAAAHRHALPLPQNARPIPHVVIDRTVSHVPLFTGAFADEEGGNGYGMLEQWIPRVGNFISRRVGPDTFMGDGLTIICPNRSVSLAYRERLMQYVQSGGKLLVVDSMEIEDSTANSILWQFGLASAHDVPPPPEAPLRWAADGLEVPLQSSCAITGGKTLASWGDTPVAAQVVYGQGTVTAIGFGALFNDANMGFHWLPEPEEEILARYEVLYALLRAALPREPLPRRHGWFP